MSAALTLEQTADELRLLAAAAGPTTELRVSTAHEVLRRSRLRRRQGRIGLLVAVIATAVAVPAATRPGQGTHFEVIQPSGVMQPTIAVGDVVLFDKRATPTRGDVVRVHVEAASGDYDTILRVVAGGGDTVGCPADDSGTCAAVVINGRTLQEPYLAAPTVPFPTSSVPEGQLFLLGDDRGGALDSRSMGAVPLEWVTGIAVRVTTPAGTARPIPGAPARPATGDEPVIDHPDPVPPSRTSP